MLTTSSTPTPRAFGSANASTAAPAGALSVALDEARARLQAALADLRELLAGGELRADEARGIEAEYAEVYLTRVAALEQLGALACRPGEWERYARVAAARSFAKARRDRLRDALMSRQCLVVAPGRLVEPFLASLVDGEPDAEILEIRAELAAQDLL
ncbi:MAG: hypothetical protein M3376_12360 [Actinomycetota bacterium]|nr:hypothetical protein [Actinomycetota bacterium]